MKQFVKRVIGRAAGMMPKREEGQSGEQYRKALLVRGVWAMAFAAASLAIVKGAVEALPGSVTVSSSVNGLEIPISYVDTDKKQVALTFDAAGGNGDMTRMLEILEDHDIHVTFFVTGGWIEKYPEYVKAILEAGD